MAPVNEGRHAYVVISREKRLDTEGVQRASLFIDRDRRGAEVHTRVLLFDEVSLVGVPGDALVSLVGFPGDVTGDPGDVGLLVVGVGVVVFVVGVVLVLVADDVDLDVPIRVAAQLAAAGRGVLVRDVHAAHAHPGHRGRLEVVATTLP